MGEKGYTLLEMLVVLALLGALVPVLALGVQQIMVQTDRNTTRITATTPMEDTGRWLSRDIPLAHSANLAPEESSDTLVLSWTDWTDPDLFQGETADNPILKRYRVTYQLQGSRLDRTYLRCDNWDPIDGECQVAWSTLSVSVAARNVAGVEFSRGAVPEDSIFTVQVASAPKGPGFPSAEQTYSVYAVLMGVEGPL